MPHLLHHKRRHSWPYCGSGTHFRERRNLPIITVTGPEEDRVESLLELESRFLTPVLSADLLEDDDAASAGIIRSETTRSHYRIWPSSKDAHREHHSNTGSGSLRRAPLDRARSLFVLPTTLTTGQNMMISYWMQRFSAHSISADGRGRTIDKGRGRLSVERNHRRCHSEQPRSWKEPSLNIWTLEEE